jgi:hypothetical protein
MTAEIVDWKLFGVRLDTEGSISSIVTRMKKDDRVGPRRAHELAIYQDERDVLEILRDSITSSGISHTYPYQDPRTGVWVLKIYRSEDIERTIDNVEPFILTRKKKLQIERLGRFRSEKYKRFAKVSK